MKTRGAYPKSPSSTLTLAFSELLTYVIYFSQKHNLRTLQGTALGVTWTTLVDAETSFWPYDITTPVLTYIDDESLTTTLAINYTVGSPAFGVVGVASTTTPVVCLMEGSALLVSICSFIISWYYFDCCRSHIVRSAIHIYRPGPSFQHLFLRFYPENRKRCRH